MDRSVSSVLEILAAFSAQAAQVVYNIYLSSIFSRINIYMSAGFENNDSIDDMRWLFRDCNALNLFQLTFEEH